MNDALVDDRAHRTCRIATDELALQASTLKSMDDQHWPQAVADAEEAISREHTMWLASRGQEPLGKV